MQSNDPYLWLEDSGRAQTQAWVAEQNARAQALLNTDPRYEGLLEQISANMQDQRQIPLFSIHAGHLYNFYQSADHPRGLYRCCTMAQYCQPATPWQVLLDLDALAAAEHVDWHLAGIDHCTQQPHRCLLSLSIAGGDACVVREYDLATQAFVLGGFEFPLSKSQISWRDPDSVFVCPAWDEDQITQAGYSREVVLLYRGQDWSDAASLMVLPEHIVKVAAWRFLDADATPLDIVEVSRDFYRRNYFLFDPCLAGDGEPLHLALPARCVVEAYSHGDLIIRLDVPWRYAHAGTEWEFTAGSLIALVCNPHTAELGRAQLLFAPTQQQSMQMVEASLNGLFVLILDNVTSRVITFEFSSKGWRSLANHLPNSSVIEIVAQPWQSDELYFLQHDFLNPASLYRVHLTDGRGIERLRAQPPAFDSEQLQVCQRFAISKDGTRVPYFLVSHVNKKLDGNTPTLIYGYGGFSVPLLPYYLDNLGEHWLNRGGAYVVANTRGGGEFGPAWHEAAQGVRRQNSFDDLIAIAEDLIASGLTRPEKLALQGGSNGGLLVASCMLQRPELFAAVVCEVPVLDMLRYPELGAGASWLAEYGDPKQPEAAQALLAYSPYRVMKAAQVQRYPSMFITTAANDDRVHPAHGRKAAAKLQDLGQSVIFYERQSGGHAGGSNQNETAAELAQILVFLYQKLFD
ncbi:S9 family peptidase [Chitinibacter fontanus]|uniref:S9 family peptidase n=1 Tax=Chitinibacter fontanus TaxID=1737446 RepID=A0A7D5Z9H6_9NEIS|nr:prolyl oligopeptidase family serine peptidase [Chitinibacter fontanus]QLI82943.1 S9 family peptidase [Chitinibacter fontanus]